MIWIILAAGSIFRLISLNQSLWLDEAINILAAKNYSLVGMITEYAKADFHPPGWFIILWSWGKIFGYSEISVRLPSVIFGVITIYITYLLGKKLISKELGLIVALLLSVNPLHIYYSQEARMYSLAAFAVSINVFLLIKLMKGEKVNMVYVILSNFLVLLSDYVAYLIFPAEFIFISISRKAQILKKWFTYLLVSLTMFGWWLPIFLKQLNVGSVASSNLPAWKEVVGGFGLKPLILTYVKFIIGRIGFVNQQIYAAVFFPIGLLFLFLIWRGLRSADDLFKKLTLVWLVIPIGSVLLISLIIPVYSYFRLLFILPGFLLLTSLGIYSFKRRIQIIFLSLVILGGTIFSLIYLVNPVFQREDWRGLVEFLKVKPKDNLILFESSGSFSPFDYYGGNEVSGMGALKNFPAKDEQDLADLVTKTSGVAHVYLINYLVEISDPERLVQQQLIRLKYKEVDIKNFNGVGFVYHYILQ